MRTTFICLLALAVICSLDAAVLNCTSYVGDICSNPIIEITQENEAVTVAGKPADFVDTKTTSLYFANPLRLNFVPTNVFKYFKNINSFGMTNTSLTSLTTNAFINCGMLTSVQIQQNDFPNIPASFASTCINVTMLGFMQNKIKTIDTDALKGLTFLNYLMLRDNKITCIPPNFFRHTPVIQHIDLYGNQITKLDPSTFRGLANLNGIMLGNNKITAIPAFDFRLTAMTMGFQLMLDNNPINSIHPLFLTRVFISRIGYSPSTNINFYDHLGNQTTCMPKNNMYTTSIQSYNWPMANISLSVCYNNWDEVEGKNPVSCAPAAVETTTNAPGTTTGSGTTSSGGSGGGDPREWIRNKNFFAIITNAMKNFTTNVQFF